MALYMLRLTPRYACNGISTSIRRKLSAARIVFTWTFTRHAYNAPRNTRILIMIRNDSGRRSSPDSQSWFGSTVVDGLLVLATLNIMGPNFCWTLISSSSPSTSGKLDNLRLTLDARFLDSSLQSYFSYVQLYFLLLFFYIWKCNIINNTFLFLCNFLKIKELQFYKKSVSMTKEEKMLQLHNAR